MLISTVVYVIHACTMYEVFICYKRKKTTVVKFDLQMKFVIFRMLSKAKK